MKRKLQIQAHQKMTTNNHIDLQNQVKSKIGLPKKDLVQRDPFLYDVIQLKKFVGTAGWSLPTELKNKSGDSILEKYAQYFNCVEINSSFYRVHKPSTYSRWAQSVPDYFRFSVKLLRYFTQEHRLKERGTYLKEVLQGMSELGEKWSVLLVQLPPSLEFDFPVASKFIKDLRLFYPGNIVWEPRHISWSHAKALDLFTDYQIHKVIADPELVPIAQDFLPKPSICYYRLHGTPHIYKSKYPKKEILRIAKEIQGAPPGVDAWCIFDNTTFGYATKNALQLQRELSH